MDQSDLALLCVQRLEDLLHQKVAKLQPRTTSFKMITTILITLQKLLQVKSANALLRDVASSQSASQSHQILDAIHRSLHDHGTPLPLPSAKKNPPCTT